MSPTRAPGRFQLFDPLSAAEYEALKADIAERGVLVPVELDDQGEVLDGHHRKRACKELGIECPTIVREAMTEDEKRSHVIALNIHRRHLKPEERARYFAGERAGGKSLRKIAGEAGVSKDTVARDLAGVSDETPEPERVNGRDGKSYPAARPPAALAPLIDGEAEAIVDTLRQDNGTEPTDDELGQALEENLESKRIPAIAKPDVGGGVSHPARYSSTLIGIFAELLAGGGRRVLDPFAGTGRIHELRPEFETTGVELEPEWAALSEHTVEGNALALPFDDASFDAICTSPTYGNRLADHHDAADPHLRRSYTHDLGRPLHADNSGGLQWGDAYRDFHVRAWAEATRVLCPHGLFVLNVKDHTRAGARQPVSAWHALVLTRQFGLELLDVVAVDSRQLRQGSNAHQRWAEMVWLLRKP